MKAKIRSRIVLMALLALLVFGSAVATASAPQANCRARCNEIFREHLAACRNLPRGERRACEARAKAAHQQCLRRCKNL